MKWQEVRERFPGIWIKLIILESHMEENKEIIDEVAVIKTIEDDREATRELFKCKDNNIVYHTSNESIFVIVENNGFYKFGNVGIRNVDNQKLYDLMRKIYTEMRDKFEDVSKELNELKKSMETIGESKGQ